MPKKSNPITLSQSKGALPSPAAPTPATIEASLNARLAFTPVPRATRRWNGITALKQRSFIANLASCGSVVMAAASVGTSDSAFYQLRKAEGAESFAAAWEVAIEMGARIVLDKLMEHAIHGTPETLLKGGEVVLERRKYNTRAMMWIVAQRFPEQYGSATGLMDVGGMSHAMRKLKAKWEAEFKARYDADLSAEAFAKAEEEEEQRKEILPAVLVRIYQNKVREERSYRLQGKTTSADMTLRQLTHIELYMEFAGLVEPEIKRFFDSASDDPHPWETEAGRAIEAHRLAAWAMDEEREGILRPNLVRRSLGAGGSALRCGATISERTRARQQAEQQMAEAQRLWEACATEEGWAGFASSSR